MGAWEQAQIAIRRQTGVIKTSHAQQAVPSGLAVLANISQMLQPEKQVQALWLALLLLSLTLAPCCASEKATCKPKGVLRLDKPYPLPHRVNLPFCEKYHCSCCNASHALAVQRSLRAAVLDEELSSGCKAGLVLLGCSVCDPLVGVGVKGRVCLPTCQQVLSACAEDYFVFEQSSGNIAPCLSGSSAGSSSLLCSQLQHLVSGPAELCRAAGFVPAAADSEEPCFDGTPVAADACPDTPPPPPGSSRKQQREKRQAAAAGSRSWLKPWTWRLRQRHKRQLLAAADLLLGSLLSTAMAAAVVLLLQRLMRVRVTQQQQQQQQGAAQPAQAQRRREALARAAEDRVKKAG